MKIGMQTWGSHGDIRPFVALAQGLRGAGHEVTLAITSIDGTRYDDAASSAGVDIRMVASPVVGDAVALRKIEGDIFAETDPLKQTQRIIERLFLPAEAAMVEAAERLCAENDFVIGHFFHYPLSAVAERVGRPHVSVSLVHSAIPSAFKPPAGLPDFGAWVNRLAWSAVGSMLNRKFKPYPDRLRVRLGLKPARDLMRNVWASERLALVAVSPQICIRQRDWPDQYRVCGFLNMPNLPQEGELSEELRTFLSQGDVPVFMTFGSVMAGSEPSDTIAMLRDAATQASVRAIIQAPGWQAAGLTSDERIHYLDSAPHAEVFPHCAAIVHHGGAGTAQAALLAGKPSVVVAHTSEQTFWGGALARIGVAAKPLARRKLTAHRLAASIRQVVDAPKFADAAHAAGRSMTAEDGVQAAIGHMRERGLLT